MWQFKYKLLKLQGQLVKAEHTKSSTEDKTLSNRRQRIRQGRRNRRRKEELPEAPWAGAWRRPRRNPRWRMVQRSGEAGGAVWEEGQSEGNPECSYGTAHRPEVRELDSTELE